MANTKKVQKYRRKKLISAKKHKFQNVEINRNSIEIFEKNGKYSKSLKIPTQKINFC